MSTHWSLEGVGFEAPARAPGRTLVWAFIPVVAFVLLGLMPFAITRYPDPHIDVSKCRYRTSEACLSLQPTLRGAPWPDEGHWQDEREKQLRAGAIPADADATLPLEDPLNQAFLDMAAYVVPAGSKRERRTGNPYDEAYQRARLEAVWLSRLRAAQREENTEIARLTRSLDVPGIETATRVRFYGWTALILWGIFAGPLAVWALLQRLRDLRSTTLRLTAHQVTLNDRPFARSEIQKLSVEGSRVCIRLDGDRKVYSSPIPTTDIDDADVVCEAFAALDPALEPGRVPEALAALRSRTAGVQASP